MTTYNYTPGNARDLEKTGIWFRDREGRYATFRGVNFAGRCKATPYLPFPMTDFATVLPELDRLRELGFNVVRLLVMWKALEPTPQQQPEILSAEGKRYLEDVKRIIDALYERGIFSLVNFHQDIAHEIYGGDGFPDWALAIDPDHPLPAPPDNRDKLWASNYVLGVGDRSKSCRHTLASFWLNNLRNDRLDPNQQEIARTVRNHFVKTIGAAARWFQALNNGQGHPGIMAYGLFNEPHETELSPESLEQQILPVLYKQTTEEIRKAGDTRSFVFIQPRVGWNQFTQDPRSNLDTSALANERVVFSYHHYDAWTIARDNIGLSDSMQNKASEWPLLYDRMKAASELRGLIPFLTELGAKHDWEVYSTDLRPEIYRRSQTRAYMDLQMQQADRQLLNWTYWHYNLYNDATVKDGWNLEDFSLLGPARQPRHNDIVSRPYAMRCSAEPVAGYFDLGTKHFALRLRGPVVDAPTVIFVPRRLHYAGGFEVRASTKDRFEWDEARQLLYWWPDKTRDQNLIVICPAFSYGPSTLPFFAREIIGVINREVSMPAPFGWLDSAVPLPGTIQVHGWAIDPETTGPIDIHVYVDGVFAGGMTANLSRPDVGVAYPGYGDKHGFGLNVRAKAGRRRVCVYAINTGAGSNRELGCRDLTVPIPLACQSIADEIENLKSEILTLRGDLLEASARQRILIQNQISAYQAQIVQKQAQLEACIAQG